MSLILLAKQVISKEESFIIGTLLPNFSKKAKFDNLNYDKVVKIASSQLMLPSLFLEIKKNKIKIPEKLLVYLNEIYQLNEERNKILIEECYRIKSFLDKVTVIVDYNNNSFDLSGLNELNVEIKIKSRQVQVNYKPSEVDFNLMLNALNSSGSQIINMKIIETKLEDVFLQLTQK